MKKKTHEKYILELAIINPMVVTLEKYIGTHTKILHKCKICGHEWRVCPSELLSGSKCPECSKLASAIKRRKSHDKYIKEVCEINPNIEVIEEYRGTETKIRHKCKIDGYEWCVTPHNILSGQKCPVCSGKVIGNPPEYKNSIWASEYRNFLSKYLSEEQMKLYTPHSRKRLDIICPDCGKQHFDVQIFDLSRSGLVCFCSDGQSYPNKFMYNFLSQLKIEYEIEYSTSWSNGKKYDIFIPSLNCIIENHGKQHYKEYITFTRRTLEEEQENDRYKENLARENGILNYVVIDCSNSEVEFIKKSILNSCLPSLLSFDSEMINWEECDKFATSNLIKVAAELWNKGLTVKNIADNFKVAQGTVATYLKKANIFEWCNYSKQESINRSKNRGANSHMARKVIRLSDLHIYDYVTEAATDNNIPRTTMSYYCKYHKNFMYYDEWVEMQEI